MAWAKIPSAWIIHESKLARLSWRTHGSDGTAALILLIALAVRYNRSNIGKKLEDRDTRFSASYDSLEAFTGLSRAKIAAGLRLLEELEVIDVRRNGRENNYSLKGVTQDGRWAQLPQTHLMVGGALIPFSKFQLRHRNELNALKLYMLLLAYRDTRRNSTAIGYEKICDASGMMRSDIAPALSLLINYDLVRVDQDDPVHGQIGRPYNRYRVRGLGFDRNA